MMTAQLGPPLATGAGGSDGDTARADRGDPADAGLFAALFALSAESESAEPAPPAHDHTAAGPLTGELPSETDADVAGLTPPPAAGSLAGLTGTISAPPAGAESAALGDDPSRTHAPAGGGASATAAPSAAPAAASGAPASLSAGQNAGAPVAPGAASAAVSLSPGADAPVQGQTAPTPPPSAAGAVAAGADGALAEQEGERAQPAATLTLALRQRPPEAAAPARVAVPDAPAPVRGETPPPAGAGAPAPTVAHQGTGAGTPPVPLAGATNAAELAHELGARMRMAVREGGRELVVNLRPAELGHLSVRVTMADGVLTAHIAAERPEAARLLQQSLPQLGGVLQSLGFSVDSLDISYAGQEGQAGRDASGAPSQRSDAHGELPEESTDGQPAAVLGERAGPSPTIPAARGGLNLLV